MCGGLRAEGGHPRNPCRATGATGTRSGLGYPGPWLSTFRSVKVRCLQLRQTPQCDHLHGDGALSVGLRPHGRPPRAAFRPQGAEEDRLVSVRRFARSEPLRQRLLLIGLLHVRHQGSGHRQGARRQRPRLRHLFHGHADPRQGFRAVLRRRPRQTGGAFHPQPRSHHRPGARRRRPRTAVRDRKRRDGDRDLRYGGPFDRHGGRTRSRGTSPETGDRADRGSLLQDRDLRTGGHFQAGDFRLRCLPGAEGHSPVGRGCQRGGRCRRRDPGTGPLQRHQIQGRNSADQRHGRAPPDRRVCLPLRHQHRRGGRCPGRKGLRRDAAVCRVRGRQPVFLLAGHPGGDGLDHQEGKTQPGSGGGLHAQNTRTAVPGNPDQRRPQQIPVRDGQHPQPGFLGSQEQSRNWPPRRPKTSCVWPWPKLL